MLTGTCTLYLPLQSSLQRSASTLPYYARNSDGSMQIAGMDIITQMHCVLTATRGRKAYRQERLNSLGQLKAILQLLFCELNNPSGAKLAFVGGHRVYEGVEVEGWQVWILGFDVHHHWVVVRAQPHFSGPVVIQVGEGHLQKCAQLLDRSRGFRVRRSWGQMLKEFRVMYSQPR